MRLESFWRSCVVTLALAGCGGLSVYTARPDDPATTGGGNPDPPGDADTDTDTDTETDPPTNSSDEDCNDGSDNDGNGDVDCDDLACAPECDEDDDGSFADEDCDDDEPARYPGATESCDSLDNDCDGDTDEDDDGDGSAVCDDCDDTDSRRFPGASESCDGLDTDCDNEDLPRWSEGFEAGPPLSGLYTTSGNALWFVGSTPYQGSYGVVSGNIGDSQSTSLFLTVDLCGAGAVSFWHKRSTEATYDYLRFAIDGALASEWSGIVDWQYSSFNLPAGTYTFEWRYSKDGSVSSGSDTVWVDDIEILGGGP